MNEEQRNNFGRYDTLTGNATGVYGHQMFGDRYVCVCVCMYVGVRVSMIL